MDTSIIMSIVAQLFASIAGVLYLVRTFQGINKPNIVSWSIWALIGWTLLLVTVTNPRAEVVAKFFSAILAISPTLIAIVALKKGTIQSVGWEDRIAASVAIIAIVIWFIMKDNPGLTPIIIAIVADVCALIPTLQFVHRAPAEDRPVAWLAFSFGSMLTFLSLENWNPESYLLPCYMMIGSFAVAYPLVIYRIHKKIPWRDWI